MIAIVVGHCSRWRGAQSFMGAHEYDVNLILGRQIVDNLGGLGRLYVHEVASTKAGTLGDMVRRLNHDEPSAVVELHWNAAVGDEGARVQAYWNASHSVAWHTSKRGRELGDDLSAACAGVLGTVDRGTATRASGYPMLSKVHATSVLLETHNGLSGADHDRFLAAVADGGLAFALSKTLRAWVA